MVLGHEFAGVIEGGPRDGERVAVDPAIACGVCEICLLGHRNLCPDIVFAGHGATDGALREYLVWPDQQLIRLPHSISDDEGAVLEPLGVAVHAIDLGHVPMGATVVVVGCGPIGLLLLQAVRAAGAATVFAIEPLPHRRAAASRFGADAVLDSADVEDRAVLHAALPRRGADVVFEVVGSAAAVETSMHASRPGGRVVLAGIPDDDRTTFTASVARRKGLTIAVARRMKDVYPRAISLVQRGVVDAASLVSHRYPIEAVDEAFTTAIGASGPEGRGASFGCRIVAIDQRCGMALVTAEVPAITWRRPYRLTVAPFKEGALQCVSAKACVSQRSWSRRPCSSLPVATTTTGGDTAAATSAAATPASSSPAAAATSDTAAASPAESASPTASETASETASPTASESRNRIAQRHRECRARRREGQGRSGLRHRAAGATSRSTTRLRPVWRRRKPSWVWRPRSSSPPAGGENREELLRQLAESGYGFNLAVGFLFGDSVKKVAPENTEVGYGLIDSVIDDDKTKYANVKQLVFAEHEGSFLVGAAAALKSKANHVGFIGGVEIDLIKKFEAGFKAGAEAAKPGIKVDVKYITQPPDFAGFNDPAKGKEIANGMYEAGADVVYHAAGGSGTGVFEAAKDASGGKAGADQKWAIGVDSDQYQTAAKELQPFILTSMLKRVDVAVYESIKAFQGGDKSGGVKVFDLKADGVATPPAAASSTTSRTSSRTTRPRSSRARSRCRRSSSTARPNVSAPGSETHGSPSPRLRFRGGCASRRWSSAASPSVSRCRRQPRQHTVEASRARCIVVGENGAGKSLDEDALRDAPARRGTIRRRGTRSGSPHRRGDRRRIGMVHQHFMLATT
jgi:L-iditol 2-dehydrogenase